jgi:hypothetical protein
MEDGRMIGERVFKKDLVEKSLWIYCQPDFDTYQRLHKGHLMGEPFHILCLGKEHFVSYDFKGRWDTHYYGDCGLVPYPGGWNESNTTVRWIPEPEWNDDWF